MKKADKWIALILTGCLALSMTACSSSNTSDESNNNISTTEISESSDKTENGETVNDAEEGETVETAEENSAAVDTALPEELEAGEIVLDDGTADVSYTETAVPEKTVDWNDGKIGNLYSEDTGIDLDIYPSDGTSAVESSESLTIDEGNSTDFTDPNTVLHGSLLSDNAAIAALQNYGDPTFFEEHPYLYIYTQDEILEYRVFAAYTAATENILVEHNCYDEVEFSEYIADIVDQRDFSAVIDKTMGTTALANWRILTIELDTGSGQDFLIQATITGIQN